MKECFEGESGILAGLRKDSIWIDHSTTDYGQSVGFHEEVQKKGAHFLEAPITGGMQALKKGQMAVWVAGNKHIFTMVIVTLY